MALPASDDFPYADGALGATVGTDNWLICATNAPLIVSSEASANSGNNDARWIADTFGDDHYSEVTFASAPSGGVQSGCSVRNSGSGWGATLNLYAAMTSGSGWTAYRCKAGAYDGSPFDPAEGATLSGSETFTTGDTLAISVSGSATVTIKVWKNGAVIGTATDSSANRITSGAAGISFYNGTSTAGRISLFTANDGEPGGASAAIKNFMLTGVGA